MEKISRTLQEKPRKNYYIAKNTPNSRNIRELGVLLGF